MNKKEIAEKIYKKLEIKRFEAYTFIDLFIETVGETLKKENKVVISNFGTLKVVQRQDKRVINPNDKQPMIIPAQKIVKFFPSKKLKDLVKKS